MADSKKAFDTPHTSVPVYFPDELSLVGGADHLKDPRERGPLDTPAPAEGADDLYRPNRLTNPFKIGFVESIDAGGIQQDISIIKRGNVPTVEFGQNRVRAARIVNHERKAKLGLLGKSDRAAFDASYAAGLPLIKIRCSGSKATNPIISLQRMIAENHLRHDDDLETALTLAARLLDRTENDYELVAGSFGVKAQTLRDLMRFREQATPETKAFVKAGRFSLTAAALVCREADPVKQNEVALALINAPDQTVRTARRITKRTATPSTANPFNGRKQLVKFRDFIVETTKPEGRKKDRDPFYEGVIAALNLQTTGKANDPRLTEIFKKFDGKA